MHLACTFLIKREGEDDMQGTLAERIEYGRRIRSAADNLVARFGQNALATAESDAGRFGLTESEAAFLAAVSDRVARIAASGTMSRVA